MDKVKTKEVLKNWKKRGLSCYTWVNTPAQRWEDLVHTTDEVVMVLEGKMEFEVEGEIFHLNIGEELFIPAHAIHSARNIGDVTARCLYGCSK
jgi:mannose-6-phosphate isomerase-like protein (cupin superfamily)